MPTILILPGSARRDSVNRKLAAVAAELVTEAGAEALLIDPADFPLPLFDAFIDGKAGALRNRGRSGGRHPRDAGGAVGG